MKRVLFALALQLILTPSFASHFTGGEIWYEYAGTSQHPYRYNVYLMIYRDISGVPMCPNYCLPQICVSSSCFSSINLTASLLPFTLNPGSDTTYGSYPGSIITPGISQCVYASSAGLVLTESYRFQAQLDLPGPCSDFTFSYIGPTRNLSSNIASQDSLHITSQLNTAFSHNSSPKFTSSAGKAFSKNISSTLVQSAIDPDGDSLYFDFGNPLGGTTCGSSVNVIYNSGYSASSPISSLGGISINHGNGVFSFNPSQIEIDAVNITIREYRYDSSSGLWIHVGTLSRDLQISIVDSSNSRIPAIWNGWFKYPIFEIGCNDITFSIHLEEAILVSSIAADGTDFTLTNSNGDTLQVTKASWEEAAVEVTKLTLHLDKPINKNDVLNLWIRIGSDQNTLVTACSQSISPGDSLTPYVSDCDSSVSLIEIRTNGLNLYPSPANDFITLELPLVESPVNWSYIIYNLQGQKVLEGFFGRNKNDGQTIKVETLLKGLYTLRITNGMNTTHAAKFVKN